MDELLQAQKQLGRTLERVSISEDRQLANAVREKGEAFANLFFSTMRMTRMLDINNESFERPVVELKKLLAWLLQNLGVVHLVTVEDQIYINDIRIRFKIAGSSTHQLGAELGRHNIGSVTIHQELAAEQILAFLAALGGDAPGAEQRTAVCRALAEREIFGVELGGINRYLFAGDEQIDTEWTEMLGRTVDLVNETWNNVAADRMLNPLSLRRAVVEILAAGIETDGLWEDPPGDTEHGPHAVRVCRGALALGAGLDFGDKLLQDLGVTALVHDIGYTRTPAGAGASLKDHLSDGALVMLRQRGFHEAKIHRVLGILYHHHNFKDLTNTPSLFGRILRIAEDFDNLSQPGRGGLSPATALGAMVTSAGQAYDPVLLQAFVNRLGRYPPGTWLQLEDGQQVRVVSLASEGAFDRPRARTRDGRIVDLSRGGRVAQVLEPC